LDGLSLTTIKEVVQVLGINGLVLILWYVDHRRLERQYLEHRDAQTAHARELADVLTRYKTDVETIRSFYSSNVDLVKRYERLSEELMKIIHLNIQTMTQLVDNIKNNTFCPMVRDKGPNRE
jgi:phage terminase large subunit-like protein